MTTPAGYTLVWKDEFDGISIDTSKWYITQQNATIETVDGIKALAITVTNTGSGYVQGYKSGNPVKYSFQYGYIEWRAKLIGGVVGFTNQLWLSGISSNPPEIDIVECGSNSSNIIHMNQHCSATSADYAGCPGSACSWHNKVSPSNPTGAFKCKASPKGYSDPNNTDWSKGWHTYACEWTPEYTRWFIDDIERYKVTPGLPTNQKMHILIGVCKSSGDGKNCWPEQSNIPTVFPQKMFVNYVRVYQRTEQPKKYKCIDGECIEDQTGTYNTKVECETNIKWACINNQCIKVCPDYAANKYDTLAECQTVSIQEINALLSTIEGLQKDANTKKTELQAIEINIDAKNIELHNKISGLLTTIVQNP